MLRVTCFLLLCGFPTSFFAATPIPSYEVDAAHSYIQFQITNLGLFPIKGTFGEKKGVFSFDPKELTKKSLKGFKLTASVSVQSLDTGSQKRDQHLRGPDFFHAKKFPQLHLKCDQFQIKDSMIDAFSMDCATTVRDQTKSIPFQVVYLGAAKIYGQQRVGFKAVGQIDRRDFGLEWNDFVESGSMISNLVDLEFMIQGVRLSK